MNDEFIALTGVITELVNAVVETTESNDEFKDRLIGQIVKHNTNTDMIINELVRLNNNIQTLEIVNLNDFNEDGENKINNQIDKLVKVLSGI